MINNYYLSFSHCVKLIDWFDHCDQVCIVFEELGPSLFDTLQKNNFKGFSLSLIRSFAEQLLTSVHRLFYPSLSLSLSYLLDIHSRMSLIHTDIKPENILLCDNRTEELILPNV